MSTMSSAFLLSTFPLTPRLPAILLAGLWSIFGSARGRTGTRGTRSFALSSLLGTLREGSLVCTRQGFASTSSLGMSWYFLPVISPTSIYISGVFVERSCSTLIVRETSGLELIMDGRLLLLLVLSFLSFMYKNKLIGINGTGNLPIVYITQKETEIK